MSKDKKTDSLTSTDDLLARAVAAARFGGGDIEEDLGKKSGLFGRGPSVFEQVADRARMEMGIGPR